MQHPRLRSPHPQYPSLTLVFPLPFLCPCRSRQATCWVPTDTHTRAQKGTHLQIGCRRLREHESNGFQPRFCFCPKHQKGLCSLSAFFFFFPFSLSVFSFSSSFPTSSSSLLFFPAPLLPSRLFLLVLALRVASFTLFLLLPSHLTICPPLPPLLFSYRPRSPILSINTHHPHYPHALLFPSHLIPPPPLHQHSRLDHKHLHSTHSANIQQ